jgi:hypothetical protein
MLASSDPWKDPALMPARSSSRRTRRAAASLALLLLGLLAFAGPALADSAFIAVNDTAGHSDPATDVPRTFVVSGTTATTKNIYIKYRNPGGAPCAPTASSDSGSWFMDYGDDGYYNSRTRGSGANGNYSFSDVSTWSTPGTYVFCIWIADNRDASVAAITQTITLRAPNGTITATVNPTTPAINQDATITVTGVSEAPKRVYAAIRSAGPTPCAQTYDAETGQGLIDGTAVNGNFSLTATTKQSTAGTYLVCLWLADGDRDLTPVAGPQPMTFAVADPTVVVPPPVVIPPSQTTGCKKARSGRAALARKVATTKKQLLHARRKSTRRTLTRRLKSQRAQLSTSTRKMNVICGG